MWFVLLLRITLDDFWPPSSFLPSFLPSFQIYFIPCFLPSFLPSFFKSSLPFHSLLFLSLPSQSYVLPAFLRSFLGSFLPSSAPSFRPLFFISCSLFLDRTTLTAASALSVMPYTCCPTLQISFSAPSFKLPNVFGYLMPFSN